MTDEIRIAFITDLHVKEDSLLGEHGHLALLDQAAMKIHDFEPDIVFVGGDLSGIHDVPHKGTPAERNALVDFLGPLPGKKFVVRGNHDGYGDWRFLNWMENVAFAEEPMVIGGEHYAVIMLPWIDRSKLARGEDPSLALHRVYDATLTKEAARLARCREAGIPIFVLAHAAVKDAVMVEGQPEVPDRDPILNLADLVAKHGPFTASFFGHYHEPQLLPHNGCYGGSAFVNEFGEPNNRGVTFWSSTMPTEFYFEKLSQPDRIKIAYEAASGRITEVKPALPDPPTHVAELAGWKTPAWLKLVASGNAEEVRESLVRLETKLAGRFLGIKTASEVNREQRVREGADEVVAAETTREKLQVFFGSMDPVPDEARQEAALAIFDEIAVELEGV